MGIGLQHKTVETLSSELDLPATQLLALFNRLIRRSATYLNSILEDDIEKTLVPKKHVDLTPVAKSMHEELEEAAKVCNFLPTYLTVILYFLLGITSKTKERIGKIKK